MPTKKQGASAPRRKQMKYSVKIADGTIGTIDTDTLEGQHPNAFMGEYVDIELHDENGNYIHAHGTLIEVLD